MLEGQLKRVLAGFEETGGFTENMSQTRLEAKKAQNEETGAPRCPICGDVMTKRVIRKGERAGAQFWGCSNYFKTGCNYVINID